jgi:hypothetical protein
MDWLAIAALDVTLLRQSFYGNGLRVYRAEFIWLGRASASTGKLVGCFFSLNPEPAKELRDDSTAY